jgi:hypothetical protein
MRKTKETFAGRLQRLGYKTYRSYLNSPHWKEFRAEIIERDRMCLCCGGAPEDVHHKRYKRLGKEDPGDAVALCRRCHEWIHDIHRRGKIPLGDFRSAAAIVRREHDLVAPVLPPSEVRPGKLKKEKKEKRPRRDKSLPYIEPLPDVRLSPVEGLPLFAKRFVVAASLNAGKTLDRIHLEMRCNRQQLDRVSIWLVEHSLASISPHPPSSPAKPRKKRVRSPGKGTRAQLARLRQLLGRPQ